jgi:hypothetical protein
MGYSAYSHAIYGITVNRSKLEKTERTRGCDHDTDTTKNFCSECGEPVWVEETCSVLDTIEDSRKGKLSYFTESGDHSRNPNYEYMIGFELASTNYDKNRVEMDQPTEKMKQEILKFIKDNKLNLTEKDIKIFIYTYHSY